MWKRPEPDKPTWPHGCLCVGPTYQNFLKKLKKNKNLVGTWTFALKLTCNLKNPRDMWVSHSPTLLYAFFFFFFSLSFCTHTNTRVCFLYYDDSLYLHPWLVEPTCEVWFMSFYISSIPRLCVVEIWCHSTLFLIFCWVTDWLMSFPSCCLLGSACYMLVWDALHIYIYSMYKIVFRHLHADPLDTPISLTTPFFLFLLTPNNLSLRGNVIFQSTIV